MTSLFVEGRGQPKSNWGRGGQLTHMKVPEDDFQAGSIWSHEVPDAVLVVVIVTWKMW